MEFEGEITNVIFQNELTSYLVAEFQTADEQFVIVGNMPFVREGDNLKIIGNFVQHKNYGEQFKVNTFEKLMPQTLASLERYLANGNVKGIGPTTAKKIVKKFGEDTINIFKLEPIRLSEIKGISESKALEMGESFQESWDVWQIVGFLEKFGVGTENAKKVYDELGIDAIEKIKENPYILIDIVRGVDFTQIDKIALDMGLSDDNQDRIECGIKYGLIKATYNGHSCVLKENLIDFVISLLDVNTENIEDGLINLNAKKLIHIEDMDGEDWVYLEDFYEIEREIALRLVKLKKSPNMKEIKNIDNALKKVEKSSEIELSDKQIEAVRAINENNVTVITGGPGTGKTTIIKTIIELYETRNKKVVLAAPTGRAAKKMTEATGRDASTLHRLLGIGKLDDDGVYSRHKEFKGEPVDADVIIVDELSMVDMFLMDYLLNCIYQGSKLILVGDYDQLPSVGPGNVLKDIINSEEIATVRLDKIFRQAARSKIILNAHRVNEGKPFLKKDDIEIEEDTENDFFFIRKSDPNEILKDVLSLSNGRLKNYGQYDFFTNIQILTPTKKGPLGTRELNKALQEVLNPFKGEINERKVGDKIFRVGDRVMQITNNYDITWERINKKSSLKEFDIYNDEKTSFNDKLKNEEYNNKIIEEDDLKDRFGTGIFNGEIGTITKIYKSSRIVNVEFDDGKLVEYGFGDLDQIEHSYAMTIHKSQR